jgi:hypothetical protein
MFNNGAAFIVPEVKFGNPSLQKLASVRANVFFSLSLSLTHSLYGDQ